MISVSVNFNFGTNDIMGGKKNTMEFTGGSKFDILSLPVAAASCTVISEAEILYTNLKVLVIVRFSTDGFLAPLCGVSSQS